MWKILQGDCRERLRGLGPQSVHCVVTSPPYFNQRDYGTGQWDGGDTNCDHVKGYTRRDVISASSTLDSDGVPAVSYFEGVCGKCGAKRTDKQIGREEEPQEYIDVMVDVFREVRRVLRDDGTLWLNLGDKYIDKQLQGIPWRVALALQADGWILRSDIIWHRVNAMPGSQQDRFTCDHEYVFMFSKSIDYYFDINACRHPLSIARQKDAGFAVDTGRVKPGPATTHHFDGHGWLMNPLGAVKRTVWAVPVAVEKESHFAAFPKRLVMPCILAGTSEKGCCSLCLATYKRIVERDRRPTRPGTNSKVEGDSEKEGNRDPQRHVTEVHTIGWEPTCKCGGEVIPCTVLDPFCGSGTTLAAAVGKNRRAVGIELNPEYVEIIKRKMAKNELTKGFGL